MTDIVTFFESAEAKLPRERDHDDFEHYLETLFKSYIRAIQNLNHGCRLCDRVRSAEAEITGLCDLIQNAVHKYLSGTPALAYAEFTNAIDFAYARLNSLISLEVDSEAVGPLYRLVKPSDATPPRERIFHVPFELRHIVGQHRYGIPGFPCLYLGGSVLVCAAECRVADKDLANTLVAEFGFRQKAKFLDLGYRPNIVAGIAEKALTVVNQKFDDLVVNYAMCWPLIAASSIKRMHEGAPFAHEYIVPQMILQWAMIKEECDGIRYFSTRFGTDGFEIRAPANYVFPATHDIGPTNRHSRRLQELFEFTDPIVWGSSKPDELESNLHRMMKSPL